MSNKYDALKRSQICLELHLTERELLKINIRDRRWGPLSRKRSELFLALQRKDTEIVQRWEAGFTYAQPRPGPDPALDRARKGIKRR